MHTSIYLCDMCGSEIKGQCWQARLVDNPGDYIRAYGKIQNRIICTGCVATDKVLKSKNQRGIFAVIRNLITS